MCKIKGEVSSTWLMSESLALQALPEWSLSSIGSNLKNLLTRFITKKIQITLKWKIIDYSRLIGISLIAIKQNLID